MRGYLRLRERRRRPASSLVRSPGALPDAGRGLRHPRRCRSTSWRRSRASFIPPEDSSRISVSVELPPGVHARRDAGGPPTAIYAAHRATSTAWTRRLRAGRLVAHGRPRRAPRHRDGAARPPRQLARAQAPRHRRADARSCGDWCPTCPTTAATDPPADRHRGRDRGAVAPIPDVRAFKLNGGGRAAAGATSPTRSCRTTRTT